MMVWVPLACADREEMPDSGGTTSEWRYYDMGGPYTTVDLMDFSVCGISPDGFVTCRILSDSVDLFTVDDEFTKISGGASGGCGIRMEGSVRCWEMDEEFPASDHRFLDIGLRGGVTANGALVFWKEDPGVDANIPGYTDFQSIAIDSDLICGIHDAGDLACWSGTADEWTAITPAGSFRWVDTDWYACGARTEGGITCWYPTYEVVEIDGPTHATDFAMDDSDVCWVEDGVIGCAKYTSGFLDGDAESVPEALAAAPDTTYLEVELFYEGMCGLDTDGMLTCWTNE